MKNIRKNLAHILNESKKPENKPLHVIIIELINYCTRLGFSPGEYFSYGLQRNSVYLKDIFDYMPNSIHIKKHLTKLNSRKTEILYDKLLFKQSFLNGSVSLPPTIGYAGEEKRNDIEFNHLTPHSIHNILSEENVTKFIIKPAKGNQGRGVFFVAYTPQSENPFSINNLSFSTSEFFRFIANFSKENSYDYFIFENVIPTSEILKKISPDAAPSIRIVTLRTPDGIIHITRALICLGRKSSITSNASSGGIIGCIDIESGQIISCKTSVYFSGKFIITHPDTGYEVIGFKIPFWDEILMECEKIASLVDSVNAIGWDVLITNDGPVILEGNDSWCILSQQIFGEGYLSPKTRGLLGQHGLTFAEHVLPKPSLKTIRHSLFGLSK